jgi:hypothetical protein
MSWAAAKRAAQGRRERSCRGARRLPDQPSKREPVRAAALVALALSACACAGSGGGTVPAPGAQTVRVESPFAGAHSAALRYMRRREARFHPSRVRVELSVMSRKGRTETVLASTSVSLGGGHGTVFVDVGRRALVLARRGGRLRVVADLTRSGRYSLATEGLTAMPGRSRIVVGRRAVVVAEPDVPAGSRAEVARVAGAVMPGLNARYLLPGQRSHLPLIFMTDSWSTAERVAGVEMPQEAIGAEYDGIVYLRAGEWAGEDEVERDALLVHELTHVASAALVAGGPLSLVEGVARYEEQRYVASRGERWPYRYIAAAYRAGYPSLERWRWSHGWGVHGTLPTWLAYEDGAAIVAAVIRDGGDAGLRRLGAAFRREGVAGLFTPNQVGRAFRAAVGRPFAAVAAQGRAAMIAAGG